MRGSMWSLLLAALAMAAMACGDDGDEGSTNGETPTIVVTTSMLGDVVENLAGDEARVETVMPAGSDPHEFRVSARQAATMREADVLVTNGADFEAGLTDTIEAAEADGVPVCPAIDGVETIELGGGERHDDAEGDDHEGDHHEGVDPHFFADPARMADAVTGLLDCMAESVPALDTEDFRRQGQQYVDRLEKLDAEVETQLAEIPEDRRILVTNHEVFGYFADRYGFEIAGAVVPGGSTVSAADAETLRDLAERMTEEGIPAVFADTSSPEELAETLADEVGGVEVVALFSESLGEEGSGGETYLDMVRTNADRISDALG